jgi:hypothetical protein
MVTVRVLSQVGADCAPETAAVGISTSDLAGLSCFRGSAMGAVFVFFCELTATLGAGSQQGLFQGAYPITVSAVKARKSIKAIKMDGLLNLNIVSA